MVLFFGRGTWLVFDVLFVEGQGCAEVMADTKLRVWEAGVGVLLRSGVWPALPWRGFIACFAAV